MDAFAHPHPLSLWEPILFNVAVIAIIGYALLRKGPHPRKGVVLVLGLALIICTDSWYELSRIPLRNEAYAISVLVLCFAMVALLLIGKAEAVGRRK